MAYTPELSYQSSCTLRRIAWALNIPMTQALERVFDHMPAILDKKKVCLGCQDKSKCDDCAFNNSDQKIIKKIKEKLHDKRLSESRISSPICINL